MNPIGHYLREPLETQCTKKKLQTCQERNVPKAFLANSAGTLFLNPTQSQFIRTLTCRINESSLDSIVNESE